MRSTLPKSLLELVGGRDDADLALRMRRRDPESVGLLFDSYGKTAFNMALRILGDRDAAEAALAEAMLLCWNRAENLKDIKGFGLGLCFLLTTYANAMDQKRGPEANQRVRMSLFRDWAQDIDGDRVQDAFLALASLTPDERRVLEVGFFEGSPPTESAEDGDLVRRALGKLGFG